MGPALPGEPIDIPEVFRVVGVALVTDHLKELRATSFWKYTQQSASKAKFSTTQLEVQAHGCAIMMPMITAVTRVTGTGGVLDTASTFQGRGKYLRH